MADEPNNNVQLGCGTLIVETDKGIVDCYKLGVELAYAQ